jgi:protein ImuA
MQVITCHRGKLQTVTETYLASKNTGFRTGFPAIDHLLPGGVFAKGAIHELLSQPGQPRPLFFATLLARTAMLVKDKETRRPGDKERATEGRVGVWCDPQGQIYPPAVAAAGIPLEQLLFLRPRTPADQIWAVAECLRCRGVSVTLAQLGRLSRIETRKLQLAAEAGGGVGLLLRPFGSISSEYAAATRWLVEPSPGERTVQRWRLQLIHGHGGRVGQSVILEACRETNLVRAVETMGDRSDEEKVARWA